MDFSITEEQQRLKEEVRNFILQERTPELVDELEWNEHQWGQLARAFVKKLGARRWVAPTWPKKWGGLEASNVDRLIIAEELSYQGVFPGFRGAGMAGPTIIHFGTDEQKEEWLPPIARGEIEFALGYTEPQAGSDVAALDIRAVAEGDYFLINGMKTFNSACHFADYHWLGARTDPTAPKHRGVSLIIVDMKSPGITVRPLWTMAGTRTNEVYYDNVRVPRKNLVGQLGRGFHQMATALDFERMYPTGAMRSTFEEIIEYAREAKVGGRHLSDDPIVQRKLAELAADIEVCQLLAYRLAWQLDQGRVPNYESSMTKLFITETSARLSDTAMKILGPYGQLRRGSKWVPLNGIVLFHRCLSVVETIYAGTSEIQRNVIAQRGLGLPKT